MTNAFISEDELRAAAPQLDLSRYTSATISGMLVKATVLAENFLDYSLAFESKTEKVKGIVDSNGDICIYPNKRPVRTLNSVSIKKGNFSSALTIASGDTQYYDIIDDALVVIAASQIALQSVSIIDYHSLRHDRFFLQINYDCGYHAYDRPQDIVEAVTLYARDLFSKDQNSTGASEISQGAVTIRYADVKGKSDFIKDAENILVNYKAVV